MFQLDRYPESVAANLALDEVLLEEADRSEQPMETIRLWEAPSPAVILGRSSDPDLEVAWEHCRADRVPVFRRCSGGASVVIGPGCLMYSLVLDTRLRPQLRLVDTAHAWVLGRLRRGISQLAGGVMQAGTSDLALRRQKFSGNSVRLKKRTLLYHGTLLNQFPLQLIARYLLVPPRQPAYREGRTHREFVTNLGLETASLRSAVMAEWEIEGIRNEWPASLVERLIEDKYQPLSNIGRADE